MNFSQFFQALDFKRTLQKAEEMAEKANMHGIFLYEQTKQQLLDKYGDEGQTLYNIQGITTKQIKSSLRQP